MPSILAKLDNNQTLSQSDIREIEEYCDADVYLDDEINQNKRILADSIRFANKKTCDSYYNLYNKLNVLLTGSPEPESRYPSYSESETESDSSSKGESNKDKSSSKVESSPKGESKEQGSLIDDFAYPNMEMPDFFDPNG